MKAARVYVLVIAALLGGAVLLGRSFAQSPSTAAGPTKVAVCDVVKVFNNYNRAKDLTANLNEKRETVLLGWHQTTGSLTLRNYTIAWLTVNLT